jgi:hypothetical protein
MTKIKVLMASGAAALLSLAPLTAALAHQDDLPGGAAHQSGNWTLKQREEWLASRIDKAHDEHDIDGHEADRVNHELDRIRHDEDKMRDHHDGQLTDNETADLEARLDDLAAKVHWLHENAFQRPW